MLYLLLLLYDRLPLCPLMYKFSLYFKAIALLLSQAGFARVPLLLNERLATVILDSVEDFVFAGKSFALYGMLHF